MKLTTFSKLFLLNLFIIPFCCFSQQNTWQTFIDSSTTVCSPKSEDLNNDGIEDIIIAGGIDGVSSNYGVTAINGDDGSVLWQIASSDELFTRASFIDINNDGTKDVFIGGRNAQLMAIDGANGNKIWDFFPTNLNPIDSGLYNFYSPQIISDIDNDSYPDLVVSNGGDHAAPAWQANRPPGHLMVISSLSGQLLAKAVVPDSAETYCSPLVLNLQNNGVPWVLYGTGGETLGGSFWAVPLDSLLNNDISNSLELAKDSLTGFIAPASAYANENSGFIDFIIQSFGGKTIKFNGGNFNEEWNVNFSNTESSAEPVLGNFCGSLTPDVFLVLFKGSNTSYTDFYQVLLDGEDGSIKFIDSIGDLHFSSANALDINNDGRDEAIISVNELSNGFFSHKLYSIDFVNSNSTQIGVSDTGINLASTPLIKDLDGDDLLEIVYLVKIDSTNPGATTGYFVHRKDLGINTPNSGIAWGEYIGNNDDGLYHYSPINCGFNSVISSYTLVDPTCNGFNDGLLIIYPQANNINTFLWSIDSLSSSISNLSAGNYSVRVTNAQNCYEDRSFALNDPFVISFGNIFPPICAGDTNGMATLSSSGCPCMFSSCTFLWDNGITTKPNNSLTEGWHSVVITHTNGCVVTDSVFIPSSPAVLDSALIQNVLCKGESNGAIEVLTSQATPPLIYTWQHGVNGQFIDSLSAGNYTVYVQDSRPCYDTLNVNVQEPDSINLSTQIESVSCFGLDDGEVSLFAVGGNGNLTYFLDSTNNTNGIFNSLSPGSYTFFAQDSLSCKSDSITITIQEPDSLSSSMSSTISSGFNVPDGSASVQVTGGTSPYFYSWNDPSMQTSQTATNLTGGWYAVTINDSNNCSTMDSIYVGAVSLDNMSENSVLIYPNPSIKEVSISGISNFNYALYDFHGKLVFSGKTENTLSVESLSTGTYLLEIKKENKTLRFSLIKK